MVKNFSEYIKEDLSFKYNKTLNPKFWTNFEFDESVRKKLIKIAEEFYQDISEYNGEKIQGLPEIKDILLTGSLANYNYNEYSDLDVHILIDFSEYDGDIILLKSHFDDSKTIWGLKHDIIIRGHDVEMYVQDVNETATTTGLYSLLNSKWLIKPKYNEPTIDKEFIENKVKSYINQITSIENKILEGGLTTDEIEKLYEKIKRIKNKISSERKNSLRKTKTEFAPENIIFKELRNNGYIGKLLELKYKLYDIKYSQK